MSTSDFELATPPTGVRQRELWLQHAAGFILFEHRVQLERQTVRFTWNYAA